jgi:replication fork clamp-binding protein CrfC
MDKGTDARKLLLGNVVPLRLGYVGVVNRCQEDILLNRTVKEALLAEEKFFRSHPVYHGLADRLGVPQLAKKLNQVFSAVMGIGSSFFRYVNHCSVRHKGDAFSMLKYLIWDYGGV